MGSCRRPGWNRTGGSSDPEALPAGGFIGCGSHRWLGHLPVVALEDLGGRGQVAAHCCLELPVMVFVSRGVQGVLPTLAWRDKAFEDAEFDDVFEAWAKAAPSDRQMKVGRFVLFAPAGLQHPAENIGFAMDMNVRLREIIRRFPNEVVCEDRSRAAVRLKRVADFAGVEECSRIVQFKCLEDAQVEACRCFGDR